MTPFEKYYDADYEEKRISLIWEAERFANKQFKSKAPGGIKQNEEWAANWNRAFHGKMERLYEMGRA